MNPKGPVGGHPNLPFAYRWVMRNVHAPCNLWVTKHRYYREEVRNWQCAQPVTPIRRSA